MEQINFSYDRKSVRLVEVGSKKNSRDKCKSVNKIFNLGIFSENVNGSTHIVICFVGDGNPENHNECPVICKVINSRRVISDDECIDGWVDAIILYLKLGWLQLLERRGKREIRFDGSRKNVSPPGFNSGHYRIVY